MPDITVCINSGCPLRVSCFRYLSVWSEFQSASFFIPDIKKQDFNSCFYYWGVSETTGPVVSLKEADERNQD